MNWWPGKQENVLTDKATAAEKRLRAIKQAAKNLRKSVDESLRTKSHTKNKNDDLETRKSKTVEFILGVNLAAGVQALNDEPSTTTFESRPVSMGPDEMLGSLCDLNQPSPSPLNKILERYANFEKTIGLMVADSDTRVLAFLNSDTPICKLLNEEIPSVTQAKKELEQLVKRHQQAVNSLEREDKKLERMQISMNSKDPEKEENVLDQELLNQQIEKRDKLAYDVEMLAKDVTQDQDKITSLLLTLVSRECRYANSVLDLMKLKREFYKNAFATIDAELPNIERILNETHLRPVFGEYIEDHLTATGRTIAYPILLAVSYLRRGGLNEEGLFRISPKQIKLDKFKAFLDSNIPLSAELISDSDAHLFSALLKSYLRELPVPFLGKDASVYDKWIQAAGLQSTEEKLTAIRNIICDFTPELSLNIQYLVKFLFELSIKAKETKMTPHNISICLGPTILWNDRSSLNEQANIEKIIGIVAVLIESYNKIFPQDLEWMDFEDADVNHLFEEGEDYQPEKEESSPQCRVNKVSPNGNFTSNRVSMSIETTLPPGINIETSSNMSTTSSPTKSERSPIGVRKGTGASFKTKFLTKMQNMSSPLTPQAIKEERSTNDDEKPTIE